MWYEFWIKEVFVLFKGGASDIIINGNRVSYLNNKYQKPKKAKKSIVESSIQS